MTIKQMAIHITHKTYPIAIACLPAGFAEHPMNRVLGCVLLINSPEKLLVPVERPWVGKVRLINDRCDEAKELLPVDRLVVGLVNSWMDKKEFEDNYRVINKNEKLNGKWFVEVEAYTRN